MHVVRTEHLGLPQDAKNAFTLLETAQIITPETSKHMRAMIGFRNIAVHQYQALSLPILHSILENRLEDSRSSPGAWSEEAERNDWVWNTE